MTLKPDEYAPGRQVKKGNTKLDVVDSFSGHSGNRYLVVQPSSGSLRVITEAEVRDEYEATDPEEVQKERDSKAEGENKSN